MAVATVWTRNVPENDECARLRSESELKSTLTTVESIFESEHESVVVESEHESVVVVLTFCPTALCLATLESAILAIDGPKMKNSTMLGFLSIWRMKLTRNASSS